MFKRSNQSGFSLIEVLVALLIFSFALLGIAGLMTISIRSNHNGYLRSQAVLLSNDIAVKMRANVGGLWADKYQGDAPTTPTTTCSKSTPCDKGQLATYDMEQWGSQIIQVLPNGSGNLRCTTHPLPAGILSTGLWVASPPFPGICNITVAWNESNERGSEEQKIDLVIQP